VPHTKTVILSEVVVRKANDNAAEGPLVRVEQDEPGEAFSRRSRVTGENSNLNPIAVGADALVRPGRAQLGSLWVAQRFPRNSGAGSVLYTLETLPGGTTPRPNREGTTSTGCGKTSIRMGFGKGTTFESCRKSLKTGSALAAAVRCFILPRHFSAPTSSSCRQVVPNLSAL
jgi:hypothetical protein